ncbi:hypothetical protein B0T19DRAFT_443525 [Cercophora scortea]|uniref:Yeast cell wall synthesis Kre9/Knh1-like N-terminal domain-containing protein n=1 Tax=Cercophora scortea TaxID=314031 RepID=A0AAE0IFG5_9PEZI|nr:hypothetical protein B0T19DRAFT_443525 [Cercophora scortea]
MKCFAALAAFAAAVSALQFTEPQVDEKWDLSKSNTIKWTAVSTDPTTFALKLIDHSTTPETAITIAASVETSKGQYVIDNFVATPNTKYSIKAFSLDTKNNGQLAESQTFTVTKSGVATTSSASTPTSTGAATGTDSTSTPSATKSNAAMALGQTFGVAGPLAVIFALLA